ncbi:MAG: hypothetical protein DHS20C16_21540 [Phycisphaerae bacterium]|nr:MAG: hypothetical protein DHS20C16_21540 [Phycisphaerae bacterium]
MRRRLCYHARSYLRSSQLTYPSRESTPSNESQITPENEWERHLHFGPSLDGPARAQVTGAADELGDSTRPELEAQRNAQLDTMDELGDLTLPE